MFYKHEAHLQNKFGMWIYFKQIVQLMRIKTLYIIYNENKIIDYTFVWAQNWVTVLELYALNMSTFKNG